MLPEKWYVIRNIENADILNKWEIDKGEGRTPYRTDGLKFFPDRPYGTSEDIKDYTEITFEQFQKYILKTITTEEYSIY